jgi:hypothetical protein
MLTYYPLESNSFKTREPKSVFDDFSKVVSLYPQKSIYILEAGYPTSAFLGGSEQKQAEFVADTFQAWDRFAGHIELIEFLWLNEMSDKELNFFANYYGSSARELREFLGTLGFRRLDGTAKPALDVFKKRIPH